MSTTATSAYLPSVYQNAYRYDNITSNSIVFKQSASAFGSIAAPTSFDDATIKVMQVTSGTNGVVNYTWVNPTALLSAELKNIGTVVSSSDGSLYDVSGMNNSNKDAVSLHYDGSKYVAAPLSRLALEATTSGISASGNYYLSYSATSQWKTVAFPTTSNTFVVKNGSYIEATISNLFDLATPTQNQMLVLTSTGYKSANLPTSSGDYVMVISAANALPTFRSYNDDAGGDLTVTVSAYTSLTSSNTNIFSAFTTFSGYKYLVNFNMDIYVADITKLVSDTLSDDAFIACLPEIVFMAGTDVLGTYTVKTNQPLQTINMSKVVTATGTSYGAITAKIVFNGIPAETANFIKVAKLNSIQGTYADVGFA